MKPPIEYRPAPKRTAQEIAAEFDLPIERPSPARKAKVSEIEAVLVDAKFDRNAYQRAYMRDWRKKKKAGA